MRDLVEKYIESLYKIKKRKTFSIYQLESYLLQETGGESAYFEKGGYTKLTGIIQQFKDDGRITVIKNSPLNGKNPLLKTRWRILEQDKTISWGDERFFKYSNLLDLSFYQRNPEYQTEDEWQRIEMIYHFLKEKDQREWASLEERSLELFNDEKYLYNSKNKAILNRLGLKYSDLKAKKYGDRINKILILENHSTFFSCKRVLQRDQEVLGLSADALIFGEGKKIIKSLSFLDEITEPRHVKLYY